MTWEHIPEALQRRVRERAGNRCEYCRISQERQEATFHIDHVLPRREGGVIRFENLALSCVSCSLRKGARTHAVDPATDESVNLFRPRSENWSEHFELSEGMQILGKTAIGRATVEVLRMNRTLAVPPRC